MFILYILEKLGKKTKGGIKKNYVLYLQIDVGCYDRRD